VLIFHGRDDAYVPAARVAAFKAGLDRTKADWMMTIYSGTRHSFADSGANARGIKNMIYNEKSARRSWTAMMTLFDEVFK
jgi:dienelactone hydrolase